MLYCKFSFSGLEFSKAQKKGKRACCRMRKHQRLNMQKVKTDGPKQMALGLQSMAWAQCKPPTSKSVVHDTSAV